MPDQPDSTAAARVVPSPNHGERPGGRAPDLLVLHYTGMADEREALARLCDPEAEVSSHYLVLEGGEILQLVPEARRAWHAGRGSWAGETDLNACSIGIEIANAGHDGGLPPYPDVQIDAVVALCRDIVTRWSIVPERVLGHSDIAPDRKEDPGERFPWDRLAHEGIGHWVEPAPIVEGRLWGPGDVGSPVQALQGRLAEYGYGLRSTGSYDGATRSVMTAFQRHFRPERVDGLADVSTLATLEQLLETRSPR